MLVPKGFVMWLFCFSGFWHMLKLI